VAKVTIKDIAKELGVSYTTVSRALTQRAGVHPTTRKRVIDEAQRMGYQPNIMARALVMQRTDTIGLLVPDITNPFSAEVARGVENAAQEYGLTLILGDTNYSAELEDQYIKRLGSNRVDGLLVMPVSPHTGKAINESSLQSVIINSKEHADISFVTIDHEHGGYIATRHLLELGFRRIAIVGGRITTEAYHDRLLGYRKALEEFAVPYDDRLIFTDSVSAPRNAVARTLDMSMHEGGPDAFFATNDVIALNILRELKSPARKKYPGVGIIGFDDIPIASFPEIELSTMAQPKYLLGRMAVEILVKEIRNKQREPVQRVILPPELVIRRTIRD
jgi:LacI family transcriptional regulator, galactose operon repressor